MKLTKWKYETLKAQGNAGVGEDGELIACRPEWGFETPVVVTIVPDHADELFTMEPESWARWMEAREAGQVCEIAEPVFAYFLDCLPPRYMNLRMVLPVVGGRKVAYGFAEGEEPITAFWQERSGENARYYCVLTHEIARG